MEEDGWVRSEGIGEEEDPEAQHRVIINKTFGVDKAVEMPNDVVRSFTYLQILHSIVDLVEIINKDDLAFVYKPEYQRLYNILMVCAIHDKKKSKEVC